MFDTPENEIIKPYGVWMRAPLRRQTKLIGAKWSRDGSEEVSRRNVTGEGRSSMREDDSVAQNQGLGSTGDNHGRQHYHNNDKGAKGAVSNPNELSEQLNKSIPEDTDILIIENKKRKTDNGPNPNIELGNEVDVGSIDEMEQDLEKKPTLHMISKNGRKADSGTGVRLGQ